MLDRHADGLQWADVMKPLFRDGKTVFSWIHNSKEAEAAKDRSSIYFLEYDGLPADWFHVLLKSARARRSVLMEGTFVSQAIHGIKELVLDGTGAIVWMVDPAKVGVPDDELQMLYGNVDRLLRDENGMPVPQTRITHMPATLRAKIRPD